MKICEEINKEISEAQHYNTKIRQVDENVGSRKIRLGLKESLNYINNMMDENNSSPNPLTDKDRLLLEESSVLIKQAIPRLKEVKETKRKK